MEARDSQSAVRIPGKRGPQQQEEQCRPGGEYEVEKGFALQEQAPVDRFIPARVDLIQQSPEMQPRERQSRQSHMRKLVVIVLTRIIRDDHGGLGEYGGVFQLISGQRVAPPILHDLPIGRTDDYPPVAYQPRMTTFA